VSVAQVLHCWGWDDMLRATKRLVSFTRVGRGALVVGNQMGSLNAGQYPMPTAQGFNYRHNEESMGRFWAQIGQETDSEWELECGMYLPQAVKDNKDASWAKVDPGMRMIWFKAERLR